VEAFRQNGKKLKLVGSGPLSAWLKTQVGGNIEYHTAVERHELFDWYASCKALLFSSLWPEGHPMTLIEAQSTGTPVIAAASAITSKIIGTKHGFLYQPALANDLNRAINTFESLSLQQCEEMSLKIHDYFNAEYTEAQHIYAVGQLYTTDRSDQTEQDDE
jgi:glycosyltransferase involved in cell wall biosynthesis